LRAYATSTKRELGKFLKHEVEQRLAASSLAVADKRVAHERESLGVKHVEAEAALEFDGAFDIGDITP
jgi:hypothetical protein